MGVGIGQPKFVSNDEFYVKKAEIEFYIEKINRNLIKVSKTVKDISDNVVCSMICCCCTISNLTDDQRILSYNNFLIKKVETCLDELKEIFERQKLTLLTAPEVVSKKETEYNDTVMLFESLSLVKVVEE